jgi:hypothetical protein
MVCVTSMTVYHPTAWLRMGTSLVFTVPRRLKRFTGNRVSPERRKWENNLQIVPYAQSRVLL